jgi:hypothetical protein
MMKQRFEEIPTALRERLEQRDRELAIVSRDIDRAILARAEAQLAGGAGQRRARPTLHRRARWAIPFATAATILVAVLVLWPLREFVPERAPADDIDGSGRVDILDAFALARRQAEPGATIDQAEIDALATRIVRLDQQGVL